MSVYEWAPFAVLGAVVALQFGAMGAQEMRKPVPVGRALRSAWQAAVSIVLVVGGMVGAIYGLKHWQVDPRFERMAAEADFEAGLAQALEGTARLSAVKDGGGLREDAGTGAGGARYAYLVDEAGAGVRVVDLGRDACIVAMDGLSPYARSTLVLSRAGGPTMPVAEGLCPDEGRLLNGSFRAR